MRRNIVFALPLLILSFCSANGQSSYDPSNSQTFEQFVQGMQPLRWYNFGTGGGSTISNLQQLSNIFDPYGIAGFTVTTGEWERYQAFNSQNFVFGTNSMNLVATIPNGGGLFPGGINSGQIWTKETFQPGVSGHQIYAFMVRMKIPNGVGSWPSAWLYTKQAGQDDGSEIDNPEFFVDQLQSQYDWTGFDHGPGAGSGIYDIRSNPWVWHPGEDFSASYHSYELVWTPDATYKYVDGQLVYAQKFRWTAHGAPQLGITLAVGANKQGLTGLQPNSLSEFPMQLSIQFISIWAK
jgi:hypothetical protein